MTKRTLKSRTTSTLLFLAPALLLLYLLHSYYTPNEVIIPNEVDIPRECVMRPKENGDCQAIGAPRRPRWACPSVIVKAVPDFLRVYRGRPIRDNWGGMLMDHAFALWYTVKAMKPKYIIESGAKDGQSTWLMRQAAPYARIYSIDPRPRPTVKLSNVKYFFGKKFRDFNVIDWQKEGLEPSETLILFDDHQSGFRRFKEAIARGFRKIVYDDNYAYQLGDNYSIKWACERNRSREWRGTVPDNFGKVNKVRSWAQHVEDGQFLKERLKVYWEFPPLVHPSIVGAKRVSLDASNPPMITERETFERLGLEKFPMKEFDMYTYFGILEV